METQKHITEVTAIINLGALRHNYRVLCKKMMAPLAQAQWVNQAWPLLLPVVKADAYGHGVNVVVKTLVQEEAQAFCSGNIIESVALRQILNQLKSTTTKETPQKTEQKILSLIGALSHEECARAHVQNITCTLHSFEQLSLYENAQTPLHVAIKCNSGMARLGFSFEQLPHVIERLKKHTFLQPVLVLSHFAAADDANRLGLLQEQIAKFSACVKACQVEWPDVSISIGNSAGVIKCSTLSDSFGVHSCRPGLALYGVDPFARFNNTTTKELMPAMHVVAPVLGTRILQKGEGTGYDLTFHAPKTMRVAFVGIGYSHGFPRSFTNKGFLCIAGKRCPIVGRVSMQMTAVDISALSSFVTTPDAPPHNTLGNDSSEAFGTMPNNTSLTPLALGTPAFALGGDFAESIGADELATLWGTIPYEATCLLGKNAHRYVE